MYDYPDANIYVHHEYDDMLGTIAERYGFPTTEKTRSLMLDQLSAAVKPKLDGGAPDLILSDPATITQMQTFNIQDNGKAEADSGEKDDLVMSLAIGYQGLLSGQGQRAYA